MILKDVTSEELKSVYVTTQSQKPRGGILSELSASRNRAGVNFLSKDEDGDLAEKRISQINSTSSSVIEQQVLLNKRGRGLLSSPGTESFSYHYMDSSLTKIGSVKHANATNSNFVKPVAGSAGLGAPKFVTNKFKLAIVQRATASNQEILKNGKPPLAATRSNIFS